MLLNDILRIKGTDIHSTVPSATLSEVVQLLVKHNCGSLVVLSDDEPRTMVGIITERDILRVCASGKPIDQVHVQHVMTTRVITGRVDDSVEGTMGLMTDKRIRHLPLINEDELIGIISIGDVVKAQHDHLTAENHHLKTYIQS